MYFYTSDVLWLRIITEVNSFISRIGTATYLFQHDGRTEILENTLTSRMSVSLIIILQNEMRFTFFLSSPWNNDLVGSF